MIGGCLTWLLNKAVLSEYVYNYISEGCPHNKLSEHVHYNTSEGCPHNKLSKYVIINIGGLSTNKTNIFVLKIGFHTWYIAC